MCRWAAWCGAPVFLSEIVSDPAHSLIAQSRAAAECKTATNGDGFGLAWYNHRPEPGLYRDIYPAWSDPNLRAVAAQVMAPLFLAHVRASTGTATSRNNCHPFVSGRWTFMHNGQIGGFERFRKSADMMIDDALYADRKGATDSEALFLIALGLGLARDPLGAMQAATGRLETLARAAGAQPAFRMTAAFSDGDSLYAVRYASDAFAPSLYYRRDPLRDGWVVVSEPIDEERAGWTPVPQGTLCRFTREGHQSMPFAPREAVALPA